MPFLGPVIAAVAVFVAANSTWLVPLISTVVSIGLGFISKALARKPSLPEFNNQPVRSDRTQMIKSPLAKRRIVIGEAKVGSIVHHIESSDDDTDHRMIVTLCDGPIDGIPVVWFRDQPIYADQIDGDGDVISGPFSGKANITKYLGATDQAANPHIDIGSFRGRGIAYLDVLINWDIDTYPLGLPDISAEVRGLKFVDPRDTGSPTASRFTLNPSVALRGVLGGNEWWGLEYEDESLPDLWFAAAANIADEFVAASGVAHTVLAVDTANDTFELAGGKLKFQTGDRVEVTSDESPGVPAGTPSPAYVIVVRARNRGAAPEWKVGIDETAPERLEIKLAASYDDAVRGIAADLSSSGAGNIAITKTGEPRYTVNGMIEAPVDDFGLAEDLVRSMAGRAVYAGGEWRVQAGAYVTPTVEIGERDIIAPVKVQTRVPRRDRFNTVRGAYYSPLNDWQPSDYPHVTDEDYVDADGETLYRDLDLPFTARPQTAQRLAKIELERARNEITVEVICTLKAMQLQAGDTCLLTISDFGFEEKPFEVVNWTLTVEDSGGVPILAVAMTLRETQASVFAFAFADDETRVDPVARTTLANPWLVAAPSGLYARTVTRATEQADTVYTAFFSWSVQESGTTTQRGRFEIQTRRSTGGALIFDGINDYVEFADVIDLTSAPAGFTVECWVYPAGDASPLEDRGIFTNGQLSIYRRGSDGKIVTDLFLEGASLQVISPAAIAVEDWTHVGITWGGSDLKLYVDGALADADTAPAGDEPLIVEEGDARVTEEGDRRITETVDTTPGVTITPQLGRGLAGTADTAYWSGGIDELRIWRGVAKTQAQIAESMSLALTGREDLLMHYWPMDVPIADTLFDSTIQGNNGGINGPSYGEGALSSQWEPSWFIDGAERATTLPMLEAAQMYDIRIRTVNALGVRSAWSQLTGFVVGGSGGATEQEDWGLVTDAAESPEEDWGLVTEAADTDTDYGSVI